MSTDHTNTIPKTNPWFATEVLYTGQGQAWFRGLDHPIAGTATVRFDEAGVSHVEMQAQGVIQLLTSMGFAECERMIITTESGTFSATEQVRYGCRSNKATDKTSLTFQFLRAQFDVLSAGRPKYWVLPLLNFTSNFMDVDPNLAHHPLRLNGTFEEADSQLDSEALLSKYKVDSNFVISFQSRLITFNFGGAAAYVEPLIDYEARRRRLEQREASPLITALMVGEIGTQALDLVALEAWFPFDYLLLLGLATGTSVGAPWVEFRDAENNLIRRLHVRFHLNSASLPVAEGHTAIREDVHRGTGRLLTVAPSSLHWNKPCLRLALRHLMQVRTGGFLEDGMNHLVIPLDAICKEFGLDKIDLLQGLDAVQQRKVKSALRLAAAKVLTVAQETAAQGAPNSSRVLSRIAQRAESSPVGKDKNFGLAVTDLLTKFGLPDADILDAFFHAAGRPAGLDKWSGLLNQYRGVTIHEGYFHVSTDNNLDAIWCVVNHLHDVLLRVVLKMIGYDGTYQPTVNVYTFDAPLDWVGSETTATQLGYKQTS